MIHSLTCKASSLLPVVLTLIFSQNFIQVTARSAKIGVFGRRLIDQARKSPQFKSLINLSSQLRNFDLKSLGSPEETLSFFANVFNLIMIHSVIECPAKTVFSETELYGTKTIVERLLYMKRVAYRIGTLGPISAFDIYFRFLRVGLPLPSFFGNGLQDLLPDLSPDDPIRKLNCGLADPNILFLLTFGTHSCPFPQVLRSTNLNSLLFPAFREFLEETVTIESSGKGTLPRQLDWFFKDFTFQVNTSEPGRALLEFIVTKLSPGKASQLQALLKAVTFRKDEPSVAATASPPPIKEIQIVYAPFNFEAGFTLPSSFVHSSNIPMPTRRPEPSLAVAGNRDLAFQVKDPLRWNRVSHPLIHPVGEYLESKASLIFALASFLQPAAGKTPPETKERLVNFPILRRYVEDRLENAGQLVDDEARAVLFLPAADRRTETYVAKLLETSVFKGDWETAVGLFDGEIGLDDRGSNSRPPDFVVAGLVQKSGEWRPSECWKYVSRLENGDSMASIALANMDAWHVDVCVATMKLCLTTLSRTSAYWKVVIRQLARLLVYQEALRKLPSADGDDRDVDLRWTDLAKDDEKTLRLLLDSKQFNTARKWAKMAGLSVSIVEEDYILDLLEDNKDTMKAHLALESQTASPESVLRICLSLLDRVESMAGKVFVLEYILAKFQAQLGDEERETTCMGVKVMCYVIPDQDRNSYAHLVKQPTRIFEQMLMNQKIEWARKFLSDLKSVKASSVDLMPYYAILVDYARKALEFPSFFMTTRLSCATVLGSRPPSRSGSPSNTPGLSRRSPALYNRPGILTSLDRGTHLMKPFQSLTKTWSSSLSSSPLLDSIAVTSYPLSQVQSPAKQPYVFPEHVPKKEGWTRDESVPSCMVCDSRFSMFNRRHHCRRCGRVVCDACSSHRLSLETYNAPVRVCKDCYSRLQQCADESSTLPDQRASGDLTAGGGDGYIPLSDDEALLPPDFEQEDEHQIPADDEAFYASIKKEFCYPQAPSTTLCISLLDLHGDLHKCAFVILQLCDELSMQLVKCSGKNDELDQPLIVSMIQHLLFTAKVKFMDCSDSSGVELCDTYLSKAELLHLLTSADCSTLPSLEDLRRQDAARRLRDSLLVDDRFVLAREVSTKCSIDPHTVWSAWGMACLKAGDFVKARERFSHCFSGVRQKEAVHRQQLIRLIIEQIKTTPYITTESIINPKSATHAIRRSGSQTLIDPARFDECRYYLKTYGTDTMLVEFYVQCKCVKKACSIILEKRCPPRTFVEGVLVPSLRYNCFQDLQDDMTSRDPSLEKWEKYLTASCQFLAKKRLFAILYKLQLFIKDYVRASFTCINLFTGEAGRPSNRLDLSSRLHYLEKAQRHLETYVSEYKGIEPARPQPFKRRTTEEKRATTRTGSIYDVVDTTEDSPADSSPGLRLNASLGDAKRHCHVVRKQIEVTKYLQECGSFAEAALQIVMKVSGSGKRDIPTTLFGSSSIKSSVTAQVLLSSQIIENGFKLAFNLIQDFRLNANKVYAFVSRHLAKQRRIRQIEQLLACVSKSGLNDSQSQEEILTSCINILSEDKKETKNVERFIERLSSDDSKINALIRCRKLKNAYLVAVRGGRVEQVERIAKLARESRQAAIADICEKYLAKEREERLYSGGQL
eukprot:m.293467 g.293467  ORF g.293467 m.293467 type:complete len:1642 (+) comp40739_c0_seq1:3926-8851(+)